MQESEERLVDSIKRELELSPQMAESKELADTVKSVSEGVHKTIQEEAKNEGVGSLVDSIKKFCYLKKVTITYL